MYKAKSYVYLSKSENNNILNFMPLRLEALNISWAHLSRESVVALCKYLPKTLLKLNISGCKTTIFDSGNYDFIRLDFRTVELSK